MRAQAPRPSVKNSDERLRGAAEQPMEPNRIIVIGASAGGFLTLRELFLGLSPTIPAAIFAVLHTSSRSIDLAGSLGKLSKLRVKTAVEQEPIEPGVVYVAPPDLHLMIERSRVRLFHGPREDLNRPSINVLFRSAAFTFGSRVIGVVLSGMLDDGTAGLLEIKRQGGTAVVQDPDDTQFPSMPRSACTHVQVDHVVSLNKMANLLNELAAEPIRNEIKRSVSAMSSQEEDIKQDLNRSNPTRYTCPECAGPLVEIQDGTLLRYRCRVGHAYGSASLSYAQRLSTEEKLWSSLQSLMSQQDYEKRLGELAESRGNQPRAEAYRKRSMQSQRAVELLREVIELSSPYNKSKIPE